MADAERGSRIKDIVDAKCESAAPAMPPRIPAASSTTTTTATGTARQPTSLSNATPANNYQTVDLDVSPSARQPQPQQQPKQQQQQSGPTTLDLLASAESEPAPAPSPPGRPCAHARSLCTRDPDGGFRAPDPEGISEQRAYLEWLLNIYETREELRYVRGGRREDGGWRHP